MIPANLVEAFGLLINCNESSPCHPFLPTVQHTLKKAIDPEGLLYLASKQFTTEDFEKVKVEKMIIKNTCADVSQFKYNSPWEFSFLYLGFIYSTLFLAFKHFKDVV